MKILVISDAWRPQVNGVVRTYEYLAAALAGMGHEMHVIGPGDFPWRVPMPGYREIELAVAPGRRLRRLVDDYAPDALHIATEGPLGRAARALCLRRDWAFTTCYHTQFPDYAAKRAAKLYPGLHDPVRRMTTRMLQKFHAPSNAMMVATPSLEDFFAWRGLYRADAAMGARGGCDGVSPGGTKPVCRIGAAGGVVCRARGD